MLTLNEVPQNRIKWKQFEQLLHKTQAQLDAQPDFVATEVDKQQLVDTRITNSSAAVASNYTGQCGDVQPESQYKKAPGKFPNTGDVLYDVSIDCRDCSTEFIFTASEQDYYISVMTEPKFPVRCSKCRPEHKAKLAANQNSNDPSSSKLPSPKQKSMIRDWDKLPKKDVTNTSIHGDLTLVLYPRPTGRSTPYRSGVQLHFSDSLIKYEYAVAG